MLTNPIKQPFQKVMMDSVDSVDGKAKGTPTKGKMGKIIVNETLWMKYFTGGR